MREINLTIIGDRSCSTTRAYLTYLNAAGLRPKKLWLVDFGKKQSLGQAQTSWIARLISKLKNQRSARSCSTQIENNEFVSLCRKLQQSMPFEVELFQDFPWHTYTEELVTFNAADYGDPELQARILKHTDTAFLYTNGGLVPGSVLSSPDVHFIHIHPGIVPEVRGSDCLYWSYLTRNRFGMSCFYMSPGIDEGNVIGQKEFEVPDLSFLRDYLSSEKELTAYRALLFAFDPHLRAQLLVDVLNREGLKDLRSIPSEPQSASSSPAYLWMHPQLRLMTLTRMAA